MCGRQDETRAVLGACCGRTALCFGEVAELKSRSVENCGFAWNLEGVASLGRQSHDVAEDGERTRRQAVQPRSTGGDPLRGAPEETTTAHNKQTRIQRKRSRSTYNEKRDQISGIAVSCIFDLPSLPSLWPPYVYTPCAVPSRCPTPSFQPPQPSLKSHPQTCMYQKGIKPAPPTNQAHNPTVAPVRTHNPTSS